MMRLADMQGIPVWYDRGMKHAFAETRGLWRWKKIVLGRLFFMLQPRYQLAVVHHELGHVMLRHQEARMRRAWMLIWPFGFTRFFHEQEHQADLFAAECGHGAALIDLYTRQLGHTLPTAKTEGEAIRRRVAKIFNPDLSARIARLKGVEPCKTTRVSGQQAALT